MTDTQTGDSAAGWYPDPSGAAAYRFWDGAHWTHSVLQDAMPPATAARLPAASVSARAAATEGADAHALPGLSSASEGVTSPTEALPSRRTLRETPASSGHTAGTGRPGSSAPLSGPAIPSASPVTAPAATPANANAAAAANANSDPNDAPTNAPSTTRPLTTVAPTAIASGGYVPLNPLSTGAVPTGRTQPGAARVHAGTGHGQRAFVPPPAWSANAPATATATLPVFPPAPVRHQTSRGMLVEKRKNGPARLSVVFVVLALVTNGVITAVGRGVESSGGPSSGVLDTIVRAGAFPVAALVVSAVPLAIVGLARASRMSRSGFPASGRVTAGVGLVLSCCLVALAAPTAVQGFTDGSRTGSSSPTAANAGGTPFDPALVPQVAVPSTSGDGSFVYSQAQAQRSIRAAYAQQLKTSPAHVSCPGSESIAISVSFSCTVDLVGGVTTTAQATVIDPQGHVQLDVH